MLGCELAQQQLLEIRVDIVFRSSDDGFVRLELEGIDIGPAMGVPECNRGRIRILGILSRGILGEALFLVNFQHAISTLQLLL